MKILIYGGAFDPPHRVHVEFCASAVESVAPDKTIIIPTFSPPHRAAAHASFEDRIALCRLAFSGISGVEVSDFERESYPSYTYLTLRHFREIYPKAQLFFLIGGDSLTAFSTWRQPDEIVRQATLVTAKRLGSADFEASEAEFRKKYGDEKLITLDFEGADVASAEVRTLCRFGLTEESGAAQAVIPLLEAKGIYQSDDDRALMIKLGKWLTEKRFRHTAYVASYAVWLAKKLGADEEKAFTAAALHDVAKRFSRAELAKMGYPTFTMLPEPVVHAFAGAEIAKREFGIKDADVIKAIAYHTTARTEMSLLEKIIYVADCVERTRTYKGVGHFRGAVETDFFDGFLECLSGMVELLHKDGKNEVCELTMKAYDYYKNGKGKGERK